MKDVLLVDGSNLARRNFHGQSLCTSGGIQTGLIYGTINSLLSTQGSLRAADVVVAWDSPTASDWRKELYPAYKAGRAKTDPDYYTQLKYLKELLEAMGVAQVEKDRAEADDLIGALAHNNFADRRVYILSGDHDFYSQIDERVTVIDPFKGEIIPDESGRIPIKNGQKVIHLRPSQVVDYKCLVGDSSDNIPGAPGFGIGAAITFFENNDSIDGLLDGSAVLKGLRSTALNGILMVRPVLEKFRTVVTINLENGRIDTPVRPEKVQAKVDALFSLFEFNQFKVRGEQVFIVGGVNG